MAHPRGELPGCAHNPKAKLEKKKISIRDDIKGFTSFTFQSKSATGIG
jgi:hypothetical protein